MRADFVDRYGPWALVTGASSGLGAEYARQLAAAGLNVVLVARRAERLREVAAEVEGHGVEARVVAEDLTDDGACSRVAGAVADLEIGLLVNNAGFGLMGRWDDLDADAQVDMTVLNCVVPVRLTNLFLPQMLERRRGGLIFLASLAAHQSCPYFTVYAATKAFNLFIGEGLQQELKGTGVDSLAVCPGVTRTEFLDNAGMSTMGGVRLATADSVVADSLRHLGRRASFVHGWINRAVALTSKMLPRPLVLTLTRKAFEQRLRQKAREA